MRAEKIFYISLQSREDRKRNISKRLKDLKIAASNFPAVNGKELNPWHNDKMSQPAAGCFLSHMNIVMMAQMQRLETVGILEDDVIFAKDYWNRYDLFMKHVPEDWDIIFLGTMPFEANQEVNPYVKKVVKAIGSWSYIVKRKAYRIFLETRLDMATKNDMYTAQLAKQLNIYCPAQGLTAQDPAEFSDLKNMNYGHFLKGFSKKHDFDFEKEL